MSVRRLAEDSVQPTSFSFNRSNAAWAKRKLKDYPKGREASAVIPLLMRAQEQDGWVTKAAIEHIADMLDMPLIRVLEVATFYTQFQLAPVGKRAHIQVCGTTPCMLRGAGDIMDVCKKHISPNPFELSEDGNMSWEEVECQGACVNAPMIMIFKDSYEDLTVTQMEHIVDRFAAGKGDEITPGPQIDRIFSAPEGGLTSLTGKPVKTPARRSKAASTVKAAPKKAAPKKPAAKIAGLIGEVAEKKAKRVTAVKKAPAKTAAKAPTKSTAKAAVKPKAAKSAGPERLKKPKGKADDLKLISGVGPKLESTLNGLGFWHFAQIAKWKKADVAIVDDQLSFKGRIERDDWIKQAKVLAKKAK